MNRTLLAVAAALTASKLLLVDSAVKGTALLLLAAIAALILKRDSAATRHLVWLLAIVALLVVPLLSPILPQWRVLPEWAGISADAALVTAPSELVGTSDAFPNLPDTADGPAVHGPTETTFQPMVELPRSRPAFAPSQLVAGSADWMTWTDTLPIVWAIGFSVLILRLIAARWMLWNAERQGTVVWSSTRSATGTDESIVNALKAACSQLGIVRPVTLLVHPDKTIPIVWGIFRSRLLLPAAARHWSVEQLKSVLLHELAHIRRRDTLAQFLAQIACALYWFNPLVWFAAWRLTVERERACDNLVLDSGVRPSVYAGHLLEVVTSLSPARWRQSCGLAMARKSSLEGRLVALLNEKLNRRRVSLVLSTIALATAVGIAVPVAMLRAADEKLDPHAAQQASKPDEETSDNPLPEYEAADLPGRLFVNAGLRTVTDERRILQSTIVIDPNTGHWIRLQSHDEPGLSIPISPVRVSPDGRTMLFMRNDEIWKCDATTGENGVRVFPKGQPKAWAPDGAEFIVFVSKESNESNVSEHWRVSADGKKQSLLSVPNGDVVEDWSADGRWLVSWSNADGQLYIMKPDGTGRRQLTNSADKASRHEHPRFAPDSQRIVYLQTRYRSEDNAPKPRFSLRTINLDGTSDREILGEKSAGTDPENTSWTAPMGARWSPDGNHLVVVLFDHNRDGGILAIGGNWRLAIIDSEGGSLREIKLEGVLTTVLPWDGPEWRVIARVEDVEEQGAQLKPGTGERLQWGDPVNGLRAALVRPQALGEPPMDDIFDFKIVVQNVSGGSIRLNTAAAGSKSHSLRLKRDGVTLSVKKDENPPAVDLLLKPRGVAVLPLFSVGIQGKSISADPNLTFRAEITVENVNAGDWNGTVVTADTNGLGSAHGLMPQNKYAQSLYMTWNAVARGDGKIPGAVIGRLGESVQTFTKNNPTWETTPQLLKMLPRFDPSRDWSGQEALALLDELAALQATPISMAFDDEMLGAIVQGTPLPGPLANAPWGEAQPNGLRLAWLLEPRSAQYHLGTPLKSRVLIHNSGRTAVVFRTRTFHQVGHTARDANGEELAAESTRWLTLGRLTPYRLAPGEFVEVSAPGIGVGPRSSGGEDWQNTRVGTWIEAKAGDEVTVTTNSVPLGDWNEEDRVGGGRQWWLSFITQRLDRHRPLPDDAEERKRLLYKIGMELFGNPVTDAIVSAFVADREPTALESVAKRLAGLDRAPYATPFLGSLESGPTKFKVLPADPESAKRPRVASGPGRYTLGDDIRLIVSRRPLAERVVNDAQIQFFAPDATKPAAGEPYDLRLPDGYNTWAAAWERGATVLWVRQARVLRRIDFSDPAQVMETTFEAPAELNKVPKPILDALPTALELPGAPKVPPAATVK